MTMLCHKDKVISAFMNIKVTLVEFMGDRTVSSKRLWDVAEGQICMNVQNVHHVNAKDHF